MIGAWLVLVCVAGVFALGLRAWWAWTWYHRGRGVRLAEVEYHRMQRERADIAEARLSEAEFVRYHVSLRPGALRYVIAALLLLLIALAVASAWMAGFQWN